MSVPSTPSTPSEVEVRRTLDYPIRYEAFANPGVLFVRGDGAPVVGHEFGYFAEDIPNPHFNFRASGVYVEIIEYPPEHRAFAGRLRVEVEATRPDSTRTQVIDAEMFDPGQTSEAIDYAKRKIASMREWLSTAPARVTT